MPTSGSNTLTSTPELQSNQREIIVVLPRTRAPAPNRQDGAYKDDQESDAAHEEEGAEEGAGKHCSCPSASLD